MGCWNGTCMISNLPILSGDEIKLVFLHSPYGRIKGLNNLSGYVSSTDLLRPAYFPITGRYDDYGGIEDIVKDWSYDFITESLKKTYKVIEVKKKIIPDFTLEDVIEGIERQSLKVMKNDNSNELEFSPFSFVMIRKDIWDGIVEKEKTTLHYWNFQRLTENDYYIDAITYCNRKIENSLDRKNKYLSIGLNLEPDLQSIDLFDFEDRLFNNSEISNYILNNVETNEQIRKDYMELRVINTFISVIRKGWMIQPGSGSQSAEFEKYLLLNDLIKDACEKELRSYEEDET